MDTPELYEVCEANRKKRHRKEWLDHLAYKIIFFSPKKFFKKFFKKA